MLDETGDRRPALPGVSVTTAWVVDGWQVRLVQPYQAIKMYRCPGCEQEIRERTLHVVVWPEGSTAERRHWHRPCWERQLRELRRRLRRRPRR
jgi:hypothetical protein